MGDESKLGKKKVRREIERKALEETPFIQRKDPRKKAGLGVMIGNEPPP
jgi:hypothetical protein